MNRKRKKKKKRRVDPFIVDDDEDFLDDEADYDPNAEEKAKKAKKRKLKKKSEPKKKRRKKMSGVRRRRRGLSPEDEMNPNNQGTEGNEVDPDDFRSIEDHLRTQSKGKKSEIDEGLAADESKQLLKAMTDALLLDRQSIDKGDLPLHRLLLLPEIKEKASKLYLQLALIEDGILEVMADWLTPYKGKLCNLEVRTAILDVLSSFPVEGVDKDKLGLLRDQGTYGGINLNKLKKSNIGQMISFLSQQEEESPRNKKSCKVLIEKFSRLIHGLGDSYEEDETVNRFKGDEVSSRMKTVVSYAGNPDLEPKEIGFVPRATIPRVIGYDFVKKPERSEGIRKRHRNESSNEYDMKGQSASREVLEKRMVVMGKKKRAFSSKYNR